MCVCKCIHLHSQFVDSVSLGRGYNHDPDRYQANSVNNIDDNVNYDNNVDNRNTYVTENLGDGSVFRIFRCGSKHCKFQFVFSPQDKIFCTSTNRVYDCIVPAGTTYINEHLSNVVYLITCDRCWLQYIGETCQKLNERFNWHNSCFRYPKKYSHCKILNLHFSECKFLIFYKILNFVIFYNKTEFIYTKYRMLMYEILFITSCLFY